MNRFDLSHPMYVTCNAEPPEASVPSIKELKQAFPAVVSKSDGHEEIFKTIRYPEPVFSISEETFDAICRQNSDIRLFVEIGTFIGNGVFELVRNFQRIGKSAPIVTVDHFGGTLGIEWLQQQYQHDFIAYFDYAALVSFFEMNGLDHTVTVVNLPSREFFRKFYYKGFRATHIYLDSSHEYLDTYEELQLAYECLTQGGVLAGDDYMVTGVKIAVDRFCAERRLSYQITKGPFDMPSGVQVLHYVIAAKDTQSRYDDRCHNRNISLQQL